MKNSKLAIRYTILLFFVFTNLSVAYAENSKILFYKENSDITDQLNKEIQILSKNGGGDILINRGNFYIDAQKSINIKNNINIILNKNTILNVIPNSSKSYRVFNIENVKNVKIIGGRIIGDKYSHYGSKGEWGMGIDIRGSSNIFIANMNIEKMWGDGIYISSKKGFYSNKIQIKNMIISDNRRQGISIISGSNILLEKLLVESTAGTSPSAGIDIEPNSFDDILNGIVLRNITTKSNKGTGLIISLKRINSLDGNIDIKVYNHKDIGSAYGMQINNLAKSSKGSIFLFDSNFSNNRRNSFCVKNNKNINNKIMINIIRPNFKALNKNDYFCKDMDNDVVKRFVSANFE